MMKPTRTEGTAPTENTAPTAPGEGAAPRRRRAKLTATGPLRGRARPGTVEYEVYRSQSKGGHPYPWRQLDATAERKIECTSRVNPWEYEVLRYAAALEHQSISKFVLEHAMRAALLRVLKQEEVSTQGEDAGG